ncbi:MAG: ATP-binding protein, partial [Prevotellaceae bacterium]|nr:ATP-binding protein [Prevotellaceae bacterium]
LKAADEHLRFIFLTGVSKFSKVSVFSGLNNLNDITMDDKYATICGYTQAELESNFAEHILAMAEYHKQTREETIDEIRRWYNGYSWDGETTVYNSFSTLLLFDKKNFVDYWFATGTPTFLVNLIKERNDVKTLLEPVAVQSSSFDSFEYRTLDTKLLLFQTGYLTVKKKEKSIFDNTILYTLGFPNEEVRRALTAHLVGSYAACSTSDTFSLREQMLQQLFEGNSPALERNMQEMFARIPYQLHVPREAYYHSLLLLWLNLLGFKVDAEVSTDKGRMDAVWTWGDRVVIAEVKYSAGKKTEPLMEKAFAQIFSRRYHERFAGENKRISLLAVVFTGKKIACSMKELNQNEKNP